MPSQILRLTAPVAVAIGSLFLMISEAATQGTPVETGSHWPVGLIFAGVIVLGIVLAYGIMRNRNSSQAEKRVSEDVTAERYRSDASAKD